MEEYLTDLKKKMGKVLMIVLLLPFSFYSSVQAEAADEDFYIVDGCLIKYRGNDTTVKIPEGVTSIGSEAFEFNDSLTSVEIPKGVTSIGSEAFSGCSSLISIEIPKGVTNIGSAAFRDCRSLISIEIPRGVTSIEDITFLYCESLTTIEIPKGVTSIGSSTFLCCESLISVEIPEGVTGIGSRAFEYCNSLASIEIPESVTSIGESAFNGCRSLISIEIPEGVTSIGGGTFGNCNSLTSIEIPESVTSVGNYAFSGCNSLTSIEIPESVTSVGNYAFGNCNSLTSIEIPEGVTSIGVGTFGNCNSLTSIEIPESVTSVGDYAFDNCNSLTSIEIPESVTRIGKRAFSNCNSLTSIEIPGSVISIWEEVFWGCDSLTIYCISYSNAHHYAIRNDIDYILLGKENDIDNEGKQENTTDSSTESVENNSSNNTNIDKDTSIIPETNLLIDSFSIAKTANGTTNKTIIFPGRLKLSNAVDADITYIDNAINTIQWTSSDSSVVEVSDWLGVPSMDKQAAELLIYLTPYKVGEAVITGTTANGLQASCVVTVSVAKDKDSLETVIKTDKVKDTAYGVVTYEKTDKGKIYELTVEFYEAMNAYLEAIKTETEKDLKNWEEISVGQKLRQIDEATNDRIITIQGIARADKDEVMDCVYEALAIYLENYTPEGIKLDEIDVSNASPYWMIEFSQKIISNISENIGSSHMEERIGQYIVVFDTTEALGGYTGSVYVKNAKGKILYQGIINSTMKETKELMVAYLNECSEMVKDLLKDSLKSIFEELDEIMGISELSDEVITELFQDCVDDLQKNGYGDVLRDTLEMYESYDLIKSILKGKDAENLEEAYKNASTIYKKLKAMDYSDEAVSKRSVKLALDKVNKVKGNLEDALYDYIYGTEREEESAWETFKKLFIQCPVDFTVYGLDGTMLGYVKNGDVYYNEQILIEVSGDVKTVYVPDNLEVTLDFVATGNGKMNYIIEEVQNGTTVGRMNYYGIPLVEGEGYTQTIYSMPLEENTMALPVEANDGEVIYADEYLSAWDENAAVTVTCQAEAGGVVIGSGNYPKGNPVELFALPEEDKFEFVGWYKNGTLVEKNSIYRFTALEDTDIYAKFVEKPMEEPSKELLQVANVKLDKKRYNYNGKAKKPSVSVLVGDKKLQKGIDYEVSYQANKEIGTGIVVVTGIGEYTGELTKTFKIVPKKTSIVGNIKEKADGFVVNWKKVSPPVKGYQIQYSSSSEFDKNVTWKKKVKKNSVTKLTVSGLENGETYYVRVRTYKKVDGKKYCSGWSKVKNVTIKKK